jgi:hypothetical protein
MPVGEPCEVGPVGGVRLLGARGAGGLGIRGGIGDQARQRRRDLREGGGKPLTFDNQMLAKVGAALSWPASAPDFPRSTPLVTSVRARSSAR